MRKIYYKVVLVLLCQLYIAEVYSQYVDTVSLLMEKYVESQDLTKKHDLVTEIMETNAELTIGDAVTMNKKYGDLETYGGLVAMVFADIYYYNNKLDSSKVFYLRTAQLAEEIGDDLLATWGRGNYAYILEQEGYLAEALQFRKADYGTMILDPKSQADGYYNIGNLYLKLGQLDSATVYVKKAIEADRKANNQLGLVHDLQFIIELHYRSGHFDAAIESCEECLELGAEIDYDRGRAMCYYLYADLLREKGLYDAALASIDSALIIDERRNDLTRMSKITFIKAQILKAMNAKETVEWYEKSKEYGRKENNTESQAKATLGLSDYYLKNSNFQKSEQQLEVVAEILGSSEYETSKIDYLEQSFESKKRQGKWKEAIEFLEERIKIQDANLNELLTTQADHIDQSFDLFKAQRDFERLQYEKEISELKAKRWANLYMGGAIILLLTSLLWYYAYQNQKNKMAVVQKLAEEDHLITNNRILKKEMDSLRSQMNPHFLFNSLNSINDYVMHQDSRVASLYLTKFSKLMRLILNNSKEELISLESEIKAVELYMELEKLRFKEKFDFDFEIDDSINLSSVYIPAMLIQPFLENAVKHGMKNLDRKGEILLRIYDENNRLIITVKDNGIGRAKAMASRHKNDIKRRSYGMEITSDRIDLLNSIYNIDAVIEYKDLTNPSGTEVTISFTYIEQKIEEWKASKQL